MCDFSTEWGKRWKYIYIILSGFPEHHKKHQKIIKFPITATRTSVFHSWKTKLKINQDKWGGYKCTWRLSQPPKGSSNSGAELTREDFPRGNACLGVWEVLSSRSYSELPPVKHWPSAPGSVLTRTASQARPWCILNMMALYCQKCLTCTFLIPPHHQFTSYKTYKDLSVILAHKIETLL